MHTPTPLASASLPSPRKLTFKRRRLDHAIDLGSQLSRALTDNSNLAPTPNAPSVSLCAKLSCSTCHRALSTTIQYGVAGSSMCSRATPWCRQRRPGPGGKTCTPDSCSAPTCAICSRTCTSYTHLSSLPPTPALTRSPSPSTYVNLPVSPKRAALSLNYATMNCDTTVVLSPPPVPSMKRKKAPIDKEDLDDDGDLGGHTERNQYNTMSTQGSDSESIVITGCGRVVCRACCVESVVSDGKLCVDCFAFV